VHLKIFLTEFLRILVVAAFLADPFAVGTFENAKATAVFAAVDSV
jgi:hypothetical protein